MPSGQLTVTVSEAQRLKETEFLSAYRTTLGAACSSEGRIASHGFPCALVSSAHSSGFFFVTSGKQDPYAVVKVGGTKHKTKTHWNGSSIAKWNETFVFNIQNDHEILVEVRLPWLRTSSGRFSDVFSQSWSTLRGLLLVCLNCKQYSKPNSLAPSPPLFDVQVYNKNTFSDDLIGKARHNLDKVFHTKQDSCWITVKRGNDKDSGYVHLIMKFQPLGSAVSP